MPFDRAQIKETVEGLARQGMYIGTSSWKYPGWRGQLYTDDRYVYRGKYSETRFQQLCLAEYAEVFKTVCVDAAYYKFPDLNYLRGMMEMVPNDFQFGLKVTDEITIKHFTNLPRFGPRAGKSNENFLNANLFASEFLKPCESFKQKIGVLLFEFSKFHMNDYSHGRDFVTDLDTFLGKLPPRWPYAVEIRNKNFLHADYFAMLNRHRVTHVFNSWSQMPPISEQMALEGSFTNGELCATRFLLRPGRTYEESVKLFEPYTAIKDPYSDARNAGAKLIRQGIAAGSNRRTFVFVNNRLEGNALETISAMVERAEQ